MNNCVACLDSFPITKIYKCINCETMICYECLITQLNMNLKEIKVPRCSGCKIKVYISDIKKTSKDIKNLYQEILYRHLMKRFEYILDEIKLKEDLIKQVIKKREDELNNFPKAIQRVISLCLSKKLKIVSNTNNKNIQEQIQLTSIPCINALCQGRLKNGKCVLCDVKFCLRCEKPSDDLHECKKEDIETITMILDTTSPCPKCKTRIYKTEGCNEMTCTLCGHHFNYRNPELISYGNDHNKNIVYKGFINVESLRNIIEDNDIVSLLDQIILKKKSTFDIIPILKNKSKLTVAKSYEIKKNTKKYIKTYNVILLKIYKHYDNDTKKLDKIKKYIDILDNIVI